MSDLFFLHCNAVNVGVFITVYYQEEEPILAENNMQAHRERVQ